MHLLKMKRSALIKTVISSILTLSMLLSVYAVPLSLAHAEGYQDFFEAESITPQKGAKWTVANDAAASNEKVATNTKDETFILENVIEANKVTLKVSSQTSGSVLLYIQDIQEDDGWRSLGKIKFATTQSTEMSRGTDVVIAGIYIPAGSTLKIVPQVAANIDYFKLSAGPLNTEDSVSATKLLAKNAVRDGDASVVTDIMSTVGKAVKLANKGDTVTFTVPADLGTLDATGLRYFADSDAVVEYTVGDKVKKFTVAACEYNTYATTPGIGDVNLTAGDTITLKLISGTVNVDYLELVDKLDANEPREIVMPTGSARSETNLNGVWRAAKTDAVKPAPTVAEPAEYNYTAPVPGLWDMVTPSLGEQGDNDLWYQTTITMPDGFNPDGDYIVELRINRAQYGRTIYVNGQFVDHYAHNFSRSDTDITKYLHAGDNTVSVMLAHKDAPVYEEGRRAAYGNNPEKTDFFMGFTDSVSVIVNRAPQVDAVQTAANIDKGTVTVQTRLSNTSSTDITTDVTFNVYELGVYKNGVPAIADYTKLVGTCTVTGVTVPAGDTHTFKAEDIAVDGFNIEEKAWCTENPYLYRIEVVTSGDTLAERFGMRTFYFDPETKQPMLNGKVYRLLGTNVVLSRFYDDPNHQDYAWREQWVRDLYQTFFDTNWTSFRAHLGPLPGFWYDIADEMGMLISDEYGAWFDAKVSSKMFIEEMYNIIDERQTHASIIFWDAQNETGDWTQSTEMVKQVYLTDHYDISERNWDNGMQPAVDENQPIEYHPYTFWGMTSESTLTRLNTMDDKHPSGGGKNNSLEAPNPIIINEYGEMWINRDGEPGYIAEKTYAAIMPNATPQERFEWYAEFLAMVTEFWRAGRNLAGIQNFVGLAYSRPTETGPTGDLLLPDLDIPTVRPSIQKRVADPFARLGICVQRYDITTIPGLDYEFPVAVYNDLNEAVNDLPVTFKIECNGRVLAEETRTYNLTESGTEGDIHTEIFEFTVPTNLKNGDELVITATYNRNGEQVNSLRRMDVTGAEEEQEQTEVNIATGKTVTASSYNENAWWHKPSLVIDGKTDGNGWQSQAANDEFNTTLEQSHDQWITIDLDIKREISRVVLTWGHTYAKQYRIQVSDNGIDWEDATDILSATANTATTVTFDEPVSGRYVRMHGIEHSGSGYKINEFEIYSELIPTMLCSNKKPVTASSVNEAWWAAANRAADGDVDSRWLSATNDAHGWLTVDLGIEREIINVIIRWSNARATEYEIQVSNDNENWESVVSKKVASGSVDSIDLPAGTNARYVRMQSSETNNSNNELSINEFEVYTRKVPTLLYSTGKKVEASGYYTWWSEPLNITDGDHSRRWVSPLDGTDPTANDNSWISVDLGKVKEIIKVDLVWFTGVDYQILVSDDNINWTEAYSCTGGKGDNSIDLPKGTTGRYVKMQGSKHSGDSYILGEMLIYIKPDLTEYNVTSLSLDKEISINMAAQSNAQLYARTNPLNANDISGYTWASDNDDVATVDSKGVVTPKSVGTANITYSLVTKSGAAYTATCAVTVTDEVVDDVVGDIESPDLPIVNKQAVLDSTGVTVAQLKAMFDDSDKLSVVRADGTAANDSDTITTGMQVNKTVNGEITDTVTVIVRGDLSKDGNVGADDVLLIKQIMLGINTPDKVITAAADIDGNGKLTALDLLSIKLAALKG